MSEAKLPISTPSGLMSSENKIKKMKEYYSNNKDKMKEWFKLYYQKNKKEKNIEKSRNYYWNHKKQNYVEHNFETVSDRKRNYNKKNKLFNGVNPYKEIDKPEKIVVSFG